jgi:SOS-response transcriptional repressor LexA
VSPSCHKVLAAVHALYEEHGAPPTIREVCAYLDWSSPNAVNKPLEQLRDAGWIEPSTADGQRAARCIMPTGLRAALVAAVRSWRKTQEVQRAA